MSEEENDPKKKVKESFRGSKGWIVEVNGEKVLET